VIGAGTMGGGITMNFLNAGIPVTMLEMKQEALDKGVATIRKNYENSMKKGKLKQEKLDQRMAPAVTTLSYDDFKDATWSSRRCSRTWASRKAVFSTLDAVAKPGAILASNTSTLDVNKIANFTKRPQDVVGMHFFSPANVMKLLEVVRGAATAKDVLATVMALAKKIKQDRRGLGRLRRLHRQPHDRAVRPRRRLPAGRRRHARRRSTRRWRSGAWPWAPSAWATWPATTSAGRSASAATSRSPTCATRRRRQALRAGPLRPEDRQGLVPLQGRRARRDPRSRGRAMMVEHRKELGITPRKISDEEIVERCIYALVNEGARILEEGIAARASDIDMIYLTGYGFPLHRGGPMLYADRWACTTWCGACAASPPARATPSGSPRRCSPSWPPKAASSPDAQPDPNRIPENTMTDAVIVSTARTGWPRAGRAPST
jgi:3-hydroxyacyl-CoA dehydrogenase